VIGTATGAHSLLTSVALKGRDHNLSLRPTRGLRQRRAAFTNWMAWRHFFKTAMVEKAQFYYSTPILNKVGG